MKTFLSAAVLTVLLLALPAGAVSILQMDLGDLCDRADKIFRGKIVDIQTGTVQAGGSDLPTLTYIVEVSDTFKGNFGDKGVVEIQTFGSKAGATPVNGSLTKFPVLAGQPNMQVGEEYLLFTTQPSAIGLSTTVGLGNGCFHISNSADKEEMVLNEYDNVGMFDGVAGGPVAYDEVVQEINSALAP